MNWQRGCGILLHPTSLPGPHGLGSLGPEARTFVDFLKAAGQRYWQILPLHPVCDYAGFSPYASSSAFAGNDMLISLELLVQDGYLPAPALAGEHFPVEADFADFPAIAKYRRPRLQQACQSFFQKGSAAETKKYQRFCRDNSSWLEDWALFIALSEHFQTYYWPQWPRNIAGRDPTALEKWSAQLAQEMEYHRFTQYLFFQQWSAIKEYCRTQGISIIGDIPYYVSLESADCWANPEIFQLDPQAYTPLAVGGVPPDYFSSTGQRWGNPVYRWGKRGQESNQKTMTWWLRRFDHLRQLVDIIRLDHFRGFAAYWAIAAGEATAVKGKWQPGPGRHLFELLSAQWAELPIIAEDLGVITRDVEKLRDRFAFPGIKLLQFAFDGASRNPYLPCNFTDTCCVVYTGTHDNNTSNGWFYGQETSEETKIRVLSYLGLTQRHEFHWQLIRLALGSIAALAIFPMQDILGYGEAYRMNCPGKATGNWTWKLTTGRLTNELAFQLKQLCQLYNR